MKSEPVKLKLYLVKTFSKKSIETREMKYSFHPDAKIELLEATDYFEDCRSNLGLEFAKEVYSTIHRITCFDGFTCWHTFYK
jgi:hypothetical protein